VGVSYHEDSAVSKLTPGRQRIIVEALRAGLRTAVAASLTGIGKRTVYDWLRKGEHDVDEEMKTPWASFSGLRFRRRRRASRTRCPSSIAETPRSRKPQTRQSAAWLLERLYPHRYARREATILWTEPPGR
jgi:hypothetical protein